DVRVIDARVLGLDVEDAPSVADVVVVPEERRLKLGHRGRSKNRNTTIRFARVRTGADLELELRGPCEPRGPPAPPAPHALRGTRYSPLARSERLLSD